MIQETDGPETPDADDAPEVETIPAPLWLPELSPGGQGEGFFEKTQRHALMFVRRARPVLFISFDNLSNVNDRTPDRGPWAFKFAKDLAISHLGVMAYGKMWYRDAALIARFEALRDAGFFAGYERVVLAGSSMGAFGALSFAALIPGAHVLAFNPQSTLNPNLVPWESRYWVGKRQDWTLPMSDAGQTIAHCASVSVFYDPYFEPDRMHYERLRGANVTPFKCWYSSHKSAVFLRKIDALKPIMTEGVLGELTPAFFYSHYRRRKELRWYVGALEGYFADRGRTHMAKRARMHFRRLKRASLADTESG